MTAPSGVLVVETYWSIMNPPLPATAPKIPWRGDGRPGRERSTNPGATAEHEMPAHQEIS
jgi:hypothetical protein